jgi:pimeloyl-ACP methyl ester carboxylesterase
LYGFSSGSVLALKAAARLSGKVMKLALLEPPLNEDDAQSRQKFKERSDHMARLLEDGKNGDAVEFFLSDMLPPEVLEGMKQSPDWKVMEGVAPTLAYDNVVMGDGSVPTEAARAATMPTLVLDGGESPEFKHAVADALADAMPHAERKTLEGQITLVPSEILAPVLTEFFQ